MRNSSMVAFVAFSFLSSAATAQTTVDCPSIKFKGEWSGKCSDSSEEQLLHIPVSFGGCKSLKIGQVTYDIGRTKAATDNDPKGWGNVSTFTGTWIDKRGESISLVKAMRWNKTGSESETNEAAGLSTTVLKIVDGELYTQVVELDAVEGRFQVKHCRYKK